MEKKLLPEIFHIIIETVLNMNSTQQLAADVPTLYSGVCLVPLKQQFALLLSAKYRKR